jgi:hypothetical protein
MKSSIGGMIIDRGKSTYTEDSFSVTSSSAVPNDFIRD